MAHDAVSFAMYGHECLEITAVLVRKGQFFLISCGHRTFLYSKKQEVDLRMYEPDKR
jgi:hypothetical protein